MDMDRSLVIRCHVNRSPRDVYHADRQRAVASSSTQPGQCVVHQCLSLAGPPDSDPPPPCRVPRPRAAIQASDRRRRRSTTSKSHSGEPRSAPRPTSQVPASHDRQCAQVGRQPATTRWWWNLQGRARAAAVAVAGAWSALVRARLVRPLRSGFCTGARSWRWHTSTGRRAGGRRPDILQSTN